MVSAQEATAPLIWPPALSGYVVSGASHGRGRLSRGLAKYGCTGTVFLGRKGDRSRIWQEGWAFALWYSGEYPRSWV